MDFQVLESWDSGLFNHTINTMLSMSTLLIQNTSTHIPAHNFLNIQWIFNLQKVLESWDSGLFNHTINTIYVDTVHTIQGSLMHSMLSMLTLSIQRHPHIPAHNFLNIQWIFNLQKVLESWDSGLFNHTINTIYVNTVDTIQGSLMHSMLSMSTLSIQNTSTHSYP